MIKKFFLLGLLVATIIVLAFTIYLSWPRSYLITGVPASTLPQYGLERYWNLATTNKGFVGSATGSLDNVFQYWRRLDPSLDPPTTSKIGPNFPWLALKRSEELAAYAQSVGFNAESGEMRTIRSLHKYINARRRTPVIVSQGPTRDYPGDTRPFRVVIGLSDRTKTVTVHDYYLGNNYEISYDDFEDLWGNSKNFVAIWPQKDLSALFAQAQQPQSYPTRPAAMDAQQDMVLAWLAASDFMNRNRYVDALREAEKMQKDPEFTKLAPGYRVFHLDVVLLIHEKTEDYDAILALEPQLSELNKNLDQPNDTWIGDGTAENPSIWKHIGTAYLRGRKDTATALAYYNRALQFAPDDESIKALIDEAQKAQ